MSKKERFCKYCGIDISHLGPYNIYCSNECKENFNIRKKYGEEVSIEDLPKCKICGLRRKCLHMHINRIHGMSVDEYYKKFNCSVSDVFHKSYTDKLGLSGEKNPAYNHGGRLSPFSKKFLHYKSEEDRQKTIKKASKNRSYNTQVEYYLEEANLHWDLAEYLRNKRQVSFSLKKCIKKYGEEEGHKIWKARQDKWLLSFKSINFSQSSQNMFWTIYENIKNDFKSIYFAQLDDNDNIDKSGKNHEYKLDIGNSYIKPDFFIKDIGKIIEFDGDYWHGKLRGNQKRDKDRDESIINEGYEVLHIRERDWNYNEKDVIRKCMEFIYGKKI